MVLAVGVPPWVGPHPSSPAVGRPCRLPRVLAVGGPPCVGSHTSLPAARPCRLPRVLAVGGPPCVGPYTSSPAVWFCWFLHRTTNQFDQSCPRRHQSLPTDDWCPCCRWIQPAQYDPVKNIVMDGDSIRPVKNIVTDGDSTRMKGLGIPAASRLPVAEGDTLAVGVSTRMLGVMDVGSLRTEASQSPEGTAMSGQWKVEPRQMWSRLMWSE